MVESLYARSVARQPNRRAGERFGPYELLTFIDSGGNGEVWRATAGDGSEVAIKVLYTRKADSEPYQRFQRELEVHRRIGTRIGVVPTVAGEAPDQPSRASPAWLAMPLATPLEVALQPNQIDDVVRAVAFIASTLADLADKFELSHRDIKPQNLYIYDGQPAIGDFGLAELPDVVSLTGARENVGPLYFLAPEMLHAPGSADGKPADVYSLAKTLYVLAKGDRYPPLGHQVVSDSDLPSYFPGVDLASLVLLIERCTAQRPMSRPTMREVAAELTSWLTSPDLAASTPVDLTHAASALLAAIEPGRQVEERRAKTNVLALQVMNEMKEALVPIAEQIRSQGIGVTGPAENDTLLRYLPPMGSNVWEVARGVAAVIKFTPKEIAGSTLYCWLAMGYRCLEDGRMQVASGGVVGRGTITDNEVVEGSMSNSEVFVGSSAQQTAVVVQANSLAERLPAVLDAFRNAVRARDGF